jgi:hypothetical protein
LLLYDAHQYEHIDYIAAYVIIAYETQIFSLKKRVYTLRIWIY